jgi:hypothetical protein
MITIDEKRKGAKMNWLTKVAIFFGRKKFEEFAQGNPQLPDDALAVANTLDTYRCVNHTDPP